MQLSDTILRNTYLHTLMLSIGCMLKSIYVDNIITGADSEEEALELNQISKGIFKEASFNLRKFQTNSISLQRKIDSIEEGRHLEQQPSVNHSQHLEQTYTLKDSVIVDSQEQKVLGMCWRPSEDTLLFDASQL